MDYDLIVVKTLERVYKNYYIIRGDNMVTYIFINHLDHIRKVIANSE